jgi:Flp pilus assembly protein TadG
MLSSTSRNGSGGRLGRALSDQRGVALLEFALIAPLMILMYFGLAELSQAVIASRHTNHATSTLGDLVSQCSNINDADLSNIWAATPDVMSPLPSSNANTTQRVTSVVVNSSGIPQVAWSQIPPNQTSPAAYPLNQAMTNLPANVVSTTPGDSVIMAESAYTFAFPINIFNHPLVFNDVTYFKPRKSATVAYTGSGPGGSSTQTSCYAS